MSILARLRRLFADSSIEDQLAAQQQMSTDVDSSNPDELAKLQRRTLGQRAAWSALTHRSINTEWDGD